MNANDVINNLTELMMKADNEKEFETLSGAVKLLTMVDQNRIPVPCRLGDTIYSVIGEKVNHCVITGFHIDREKIYMETEEGMFLNADNIGTYYFLSQDLAEKEFERRWRKRR